jgi:hypothetical protein
MSLSVCLLTRNEEAHVARALRSVAGLADEVIVADTASRDRTAQIAAGLGARVVQFPWDDDFAAGRNFVLGHAAGDWVLWLNATEELLPASHAALRECLTRDNVFGYFVLVQHPMDEDPTAGFGEALDLRLFRRRPDVRFVGRLHPTFTPEVVEAVRRDGLAVAPCGVTLRAVPSGERGESKLRWTARLLDLELHDRPGQLHYLIEYGRTLLRLNDARGHDVLAEAAGQVAAVRDAAAAPALKVQALLDYLLDTQPGSVRGPLTRADAHELAQRWFPASPPLLYKCAEDCFRRDDFRRARELLERLVHLGKTGGYDRSRAFDPGLVGDDAVINLAACHRRLGDLDRAEQCYRQLLDSPHFRAQAARELAAVQAERRPGGPFSFTITSEGVE